MYDLSQLTLRDITECSTAIRGMAEAECMETVAQKIVGFIHQRFVEAKRHQRSCVLVRLFKTQAYGDLPEPIQTFADELASNTILDGNTQCLTLLGTAGEKNEWFDRTQSEGHQAIPLPTKQAIEKIPMISRLIYQLGVEVRHIVEPDPKLMLDLSQKSYNVFWVENAIDSPYIPAQEEFVEPMGVRSALGCGGLLPTGDFFALVIFSRTPITRRAAGLFNPIALSIKLALMSFGGKKVFAE